MESSNDFATTIILFLLFVIFASSFLRSFRLLTRRCMARARILRRRYGLSCGKLARLRFRCCLLLAAALVSGGSCFFSAFQSSAVVQSVDRSVAVQIQDAASISEDSFEDVEDVRFTQVSASGDPRFGGGQTVQVAFMPLIPARVSEFEESKEFSSRR